MMKREEDTCSPVGKLDDSEPRPQGLDQELVTRFVAGERSAFDQVFQLMRRDIFHVVQRLFRSPFDQEEAFQEAWLQIYRVRHQFDVNRHTELLPWARQVARNRAIDLIKARVRRPDVPIPVEEMDMPSDASQFGTLVQSRLRRQLDAFVQRLDPEQREFFALCFVEEMPHEEVARRMSISVRRCKYLKKKLLARILRNAELRQAAT